MTPFVFGNVLLFLSIMLGAGSQIFFKLSFNAVGSLRLDSGVWQQISNPRALLFLAVGFAMLIAGFIFWMSSLTKLNLSYAYPLACGSALLVVALSALFLGEAVTLKMWCGAALVALGTGLLVNSQ
jgi:uncharacterized membrane protein